MKRLFFVLAFVMMILSACGGNNAQGKKPLFEEDENGNKLYKNESGEYVKDNWVDINGDNYYFDRNGYLVTNKWVQDEYYVDNNGKMKKDFWYEENGKMYYLQTDGKYAHDCIVEIDGKKYVFNSDGTQMTNNIFYDTANTKAYYIDDNGNIDTNSGYKIVNNSNCFVDENGEVIFNKWKEDNGKWYFYGADGLMAKNSFVDTGFYVDENGEMVCNKEIKIGDIIFVFDDNGYGKIKEEKKVSFKELIEKYCYVEYNGKNIKLSEFSVSDDDSTLEVEGMFRTMDIWGMSDKFYVDVNNNTRIADVSGADNYVLRALGNINKELKFPASVLTQIKNTSANDGMKTVSSNGVTLTWTVNTSYGHNVNLHLTYTK